MKMRTFVLLLAIAVYLVLEIHASTLPHHTGGGSSSHSDTHEDKAKKEGSKAKKIQAKLAKINPHRKRRSVVHEHSQAQAQAGGTAHDVHEERAEKEGSKAKKIQAKLAKINPHRKRRSAEATDDNAEDVPDVNYPADILSRVDYADCPDGARFKKFIDEIKADPELLGPDGYDVASTPIAQYHSHCAKKSSDCSESGIVSGSDAKLIVDKHNEYRAEEHASNMLKMHWDRELAQTALGWAQQCRWSHDKSINRDSPGRFDVGQNLAQSTNPMTWAQIMKFWHDEFKFWKLGEGAVEQPDGSFKMVGHFTQLVDWQSYKVGCAYAKCDKIHFGAGDTEPGYIYACDYGAAGNRDGFKYPYKEGSPICAAEFMKGDGLCDCAAQGKSCGYLEQFDETNCECKSMYDLGDFNSDAAKGDKCSKAEEVGTCVEDDWEMPVDCPDGDMTCCCAHPKGNGQTEGTLYKVNPGKSCSWSFHNNDDNCKQVSTCFTPADSDMSEYTNECG